MTGVTELLRGWAELWGVPGLEQRIHVTFDPRLRTTLGLCHPARRVIRLHPALRSAPPEVLLPVLAHEAAHAAAFDLAPDALRPHGPEWGALMRRAGFEPLVRLAVDPGLGIEPPTRRTPVARVYEHHCPVCQMVRRARRPVHGWRCAACVAAGLDGVLEIQARPAIAGLRP